LSILTLVTIIASVLILLSLLATAFVVGYELAARRATKEVFKTIDAATVGVDPDVKDYKDRLRGLLDE
jgi:hypothetical protein